MAFNINKTAPQSLDSPEALFRDIKTKKVRGPLADQADLWREYQDKALTKSDIALRLPIGGGKTLVGLVLAEWRRLKFGERVVYLCPTKQLVNQVVEQSINHYGIKVNGFTGRKAEYDKDLATEYQNCERVAVTNYSSLFNSAPFFEDPHIIILDDAHASEQYIAGMWSLVINRNDINHRALYESLIAVLKPVISKASYQRLAVPEESFYDRQWVDKLPTPTLYSIAAELIGVIDSQVLSPGYNASDHKFAWSEIRDHLGACHLYFSAGSILIRPLIAPTKTHRPFTEAKQRIYMSATFGEAGELERISGRPKIDRLQVKAGWDRQTIGRRYFLFPERSLTEEKQLELCAKMIVRSGRSLVLTPDGKKEKSFREFIGSSVRYPVFNAQDIELSKSDFISKDRAVAIVANRYDGIDFPEDQCRLLIIEGLPRATNLQEQFLIFRMGAVDLLNVRITTRLVQAFGRCTRSDQDYSAVIVRGEELNKYLMTPERRALLHPELQAELNFGIEQSKKTTVEIFLENFEIFLEQGDDWRAANADILAKREHLKQDQPPWMTDLAATSSIEIDYVNAIWNNNYESAFAHAKSVLAILNDEKLRGYRALWHYLAGSAALLAFENGSVGFDAQAREQYATALKAEGAISWLVPLSKRAGIADSGVKNIDSKDTADLIERIENLFDNLGTLTDYKYNLFETEIRTKLEKNEASVFEDGHAKLGKLLGYDAGNRNDTASPDPWWMANGSLCFIFEDHSDAKPESSLSVEKARQVCTHPNWAKENLPLEEDATIIPILVTPVSVADKEALPHLKEVLIWNLDEYRKWARNAITVIREIRKEYPNSGDLFWRTSAAEKLSKAGITPSSLREMLKDNVAARVLNIKKES
jgi:DEAD/DEAH box helicase/Helicase C-terminal domain